MVNKLLIGVGIVALVAVGSIGVWQLAGGNGDRRVGAIGDEPLKEGTRGTLRWRGPFHTDLQYEPLDIVSHEGSSWIAADVVEQGVAPPEGGWDLLAQAGAAGAPGAQGAQGAAGTFTGTFQSPDGKYKLSVTDAGIDARGPNGWVTIDNGGVVVRSGTALVVDAGTTLELKAAAAASLRGAMTRIGCASGGTSVARRGDRVSLPSSSGGFPGGAFPIVEGSPTVLVC